MKAILLICLLTISNLCLAEDVGYEVELIIFEDASGLYKNSENWKVEIESSLKEAEAKKAIKKSASVSANKKLVLQPIDIEKYRLNKQAAKLRENSRYKVLYHKAWKQLGLNKELALPIMINTQNTSTATDENATIKSESFIEGDFMLIMSRYLHVISNLTLHKPRNPLQKPINNIDSDDDSENEKSAQAQDILFNNYDQFPLVFERRMRSKETHYIDHPLGGMIVLVTPYKIEDESEEAKPTSGYKIL